MWCLMSNDYVTLSISLSLSTLCVMPSLYSNLCHPSIHPLEICEKSCITHMSLIMGSLDRWMEVKSLQSISIPFFSLSLSLSPSHSLPLSPYLSFFLYLFSPLTASIWTIIQVQISWWPTALQPVKCAGICFSNLCNASLPRWWIWEVRHNSRFTISFHLKDHFLANI